MPVYNAIPYLPEAVGSILAQTYRDFAFLIINDGSTDGSGEYLGSLSDPRLQVVNQPNRGLGATLNRAIGLCQTPYLARMDADDISLPDRLERQMKYLVAHRDVVMLGTQVCFFSGRRSFRGPVKPLEHGGIRGGLLAGRATVCHGSCVFDAEALRKAGGYRVDRAGEDIDLFLRMSEIGCVANLPEVLYRIRVHRSSTCYSAGIEVQMWRHYAICCARRREIGKPEPAPEEFRREWARRGIVRRVVDGLDVWSARQYRQAMVDLGDGAAIRGTARMGLAALCRPGGTLRRVKSAVCMLGRLRPRATEAGC